MFTQQEYIFAWLFYVLGASLFIFGFVKLTRFIKWWQVRFVLCATVAAFILVPWQTQNGDSYLSPAWIAAILEGAFEGDGAFWRAGTPLLAALIVTLLGSAAVTFFMWLFRSKGTDSVTSN